MKLILQKLFDQDGCYNKNLWRRYILYIFTSVQKGCVSGLQVVAMVILYYTRPTYFKYTWLGVLDHTNANENKNANKESTIHLPLGLLY